MAFTAEPKGRRNLHGGWCSSCGGWCEPYEGSVTPRAEGGNRVDHVDCTGKAEARPPGRKRG